MNQYNEDLNFVLIIMILTKRISKERYIYNNEYEFYL